MRIVLLVTALLSTPAAMASETAADCEDGQWWTGYRATRAAQLAAEDALQGRGIGVAACEGEQWDGQDTVHPQRDASCVGTFHPDPFSPFAAVCLGSDPNAMRGDDPLTPLAFRAGGASGDGAHEAYVAANVAFVGRVALYAGACDGGAGLEGEADCRGSQEARAGAYARDNTPGNMIMILVDCMFSRVTCPVNEADCSYEHYARDAEQGYRTCSRDNTAAGAGVVLA